MRDSYSRTVLKEHGCTIRKLDYFLEKFTGLVSIKQFLVADKGLGFVALFRRLTAAYKKKRCQNRDDI